MRKHQVLIGIAVAVLGCESSGRGGGSTASVGGSCTESQSKSDQKVCDSSRKLALECKAATEAGKFEWKEDKNCGAQGLTCSSGACVAPTTSGSGDASTASDSTSGACTDLAGTWTFSSHCTSSYEGTSLSVSQSGCTFSFSGGGLSAASGTVSGSSLTVSGIGSQGVTNCSGTIEFSGSTADQLELSCTPTCNVKLKR